MKTVSILAGMSANMAVTWFACLEKWDGCRHGPSLENDGTKMIDEFRNKRFEGEVGVESEVWDFARVAGQ
jgi:hypothetical protein